MAKLVLPPTNVRREFVDEDDRIAVAVFLEIELGQSFSLSPNSASIDSLVCLAGMTSLFVDWFKGYASRLWWHHRSDRSSTRLVVLLRRSRAMTAAGSPPKGQLSLPLVSVL
jgi:hypothetical protein